MNEEQVRKIVKQEIDKNNTSGSPVIAPHSHNGNDNLQVSENDVTLGNKTQIEISMANTSGGVVNVPILLTSITRPSLLIFNGYAYTTGAKSVINGYVVFGPCLSNSIVRNYGTSGDQIQVSNQGGSITPFVSGSNFIYIDTTTLGNANVGQDNITLAAVQDASSTTTVLLFVSQVGLDGIHLILTLNSGWGLFGSITAL